MFLEAAAAQGGVEGRSKKRLGGPSLMILNVMTSGVEIDAIRSG
jgi:hypothetical protein